MPDSASPIPVPAPSRRRHVIVGRGPDGADATIVVDLDPLEPGGWAAKVYAPGGALLNARALDELLVALAEADPDTFLVSRERLTALLALEERVDADAEREAAR